MTSTPAGAWIWTKDDRTGHPSGTAASEPASRPSEVRPVVAVFDLRDQRGLLDRATLRHLTDALAAQLTQGGHFRVVPGAQIRARLAQKKQGSYRDCYDESCQLELGRALFAQKSLDSTILSIGNRCRVTAVLYDLRTETTDHAAAVHTACEVEALLAAMTDLACALAR